MMDRIPFYVYSRCVVLCKNYYALLTRIREIERDIILASPPPGDGQPRGNRAGDPTAGKAMKLIAAKDTAVRQKNAIDRAMDSLPDEAARQFIIKNLFDRMPMAYIDLPMSEITMKRTRRAFILRVAENLGEI